MARFRLLHTNHNLIKIPALDSQKPSPMMAIKIPQNRHGIRCFSTPPDHHESIIMADDENKKQRETPQVLRIAVSGVTELLRLFSSFNQTTREDEEQRDELSVSSVDDIVTILEQDYQNAYFVTGIFSSAIYAEDCVFEDPTIQFRGKELYSRNLKLLVPFFDSPYIGLKKIQKVLTSEPNFVEAKWKLRTYLRLPWRPLIIIDGSTIYELDDEFRIIRHAESWSVSAFEAIVQIFTPSFGRTED